MITFILVVIGALVMIGPLVYILDYESKYTHTITVEPSVPKLVTEKKSDSMVMDTDISILEVINQIELELEEENKPKAISQPSAKDIIDHEVTINYSMSNTHRDFYCTWCGKISHGEYLDHYHTY